MTHSTHPQGVTLLHCLQLEDLCNTHIHRFADRPSVSPTECSTASYTAAYVQFASPMPVCYFARTFLVLHCRFAAFLGEVSGPGCTV